MDATKGDKQDPKEMLLWNNYYNFGYNKDPEGKYFKLRTQLEECIDIDEIDPLFNSHDFSKNIRHRTAFLYGLMGVAQVFS